MFQTWKPERVATIDDALAGMVRGRHDGCFCL